eukprot:SAG31_NODE_1389_length_8545_cov_3.081103_7_plen_220_part_00
MISSGRACVIDALPPRWHLGLMNKNKKDKPPGRVSPSPEPKARRKRGGSSTCIAALAVVGLALGLGLRGCGTVCTEPILELLPQEMVAYFPTVGHAAAWVVQQTPGTETAKLGVEGTASKGNAGEASVAPDASTAETSATTHSVRQGTEEPVAQSAPAATGAAETFSIPVNVGGKIGTVPLVVHEGESASAAAKAFAVKYGLADATLPQLEEAIANAIK